MQNRYIIGLFLLILIPVIGMAQPTEDEKIVRTVADNILAHSSWDFIDTETDEVIQEVTKKNYRESIAIRSPYNTWHYWNGVLNIAMMDMAKYYNDPKYEEYARKNYEFAFKYAPVFAEKYRTEDMDRWQAPFGQWIVTRELDDCGAMGGGLIEVYREDRRKDYRAYIDKAADHIMNRQERLADGTLMRSFPHDMTLWADDLYMSIVFLARMGSLTGEMKYFDDAAKQVILFTKYLYNPKKELYYHGWYSDLERNSVAHWGRCNGWVMMAQANLLNFLPEDHPQRDTLISILNQQILGISRYQGQTGLWHQLLDKNDSYLETSCTAMFTYSIAKAVNEGWIHPDYGSIAVQGWNGIKSKIQEDGQVEDICVGTGIDDDLIFYYNRPKKLNDIHGLGAVLLAGMEVVKMANSK